MNAPEPVGTLQVALAHAARLLQSDPALAIEQAMEILKAVPNHAAASLILAAAYRASGQVERALAMLNALAAMHSGSAAVQYELGLALGMAGRGEQAVAALREAVHLEPAMPEAWRALADHLTAMGDLSGADHAYAQQIKHSSKDPRLFEAAMALCEQRVASAEALLREHLKTAPTDVAAIRMLAEVAARLGRYGDAEALLARCLELAPSFVAARHNYALVLHRQNKSARALQEIERVLAAEPNNPSYRNLKAAIVGRLGQYETALHLYAQVLTEYPNNAKVWMSYGHALKTAGRQQDSIAAYRKSLELAPHLGEAWWSLANLKTFKFVPEELNAMRTQLRSASLSDEDRLHFHFAIGKALEDSQRYAESFEHYAAGNALRRQALKYDPDEHTRHVYRSKRLFTKEFFAARAGVGCAAADPIFIVGLPRSGSTLLEQILASHSLVEGTMELPDILSIARELGGRKSKSDASKYPEILASVDAQQLRTLGEQYLERTRIQRKTDAPYFIDKMPNNFAHLGLIQLILPNAKIIDARRHPLGCCFSAFKQHFARGQHFTYGLEDVGRYYRDYVELMAHFDEVLPGRVHRVVYEEIVEHTEAQIRRLLDYCGLPFEEQCLRFYENERAVRTASSEQVRRPIYREALDQWKHYEPWIEPLKRTLGAVLDEYPGAPRFTSDSTQRSSELMGSPR